MKINRKPRDSEELVAYIGYRNQQANSLKGALVIFFSEHKFKPAMFSLDGIRIYHEETNSSFSQLLSRTQKYDTRKTLEKFKSQYGQVVVLNFDNLLKEEVRFVFLSLIASPQIIRDTNATITMKAVLVPDDPSLGIESFPLVSHVVKSHDPNRMLISKRRINNIFLKRKELIYTVEFQNTGEGPSDSIRISIKLPSQLNAKTLKIKEMSIGDMQLQDNPNYVDNLKIADSVYFIFRKIYLPGLKENLVKTEDSTKGMVKYSIKFRKRPNTSPFTTRAHIVFNKNEPVPTNYVKAVFARGWSPGITVGYNLFLSNGNYTAKGPIQIGYMLEQYGPSRLHMQFELHAGIMQQEDTTGKPNGVDVAKVQREFNLNQSLLIDVKNSWHDTAVTTTRNILQVVPLHIRYDITNWLGIGIGVMAQIAISEKTKINDKYHLHVQNSQSSPHYDLDLSKTISASSTRMFATTNYAPFADVQLGVLRSRLTAGLRYYHLGKGNLQNQFFVYAGIKL